MTVNTPFFIQTQKFYHICSGIFLVEEIHSYTPLLYTNNFLLFLHCKPSLVRFCKSLHISINCFLTYKLNTEQQEHFQSSKFSCNIWTNTTELRG